MVIFFLVQFLGKERENVNVRPLLHLDDQIECFLNVKAFYF